MPPPSKRDSGKNKDVTARTARTADTNGDFSATCRRLLLPLPTSRVGIPNAVGEQPIQIGKVCIAVDEEAQAFAIFLARPLAVPRLPPRIVRVEVQARQRLPAAMGNSGFTERFRHADPKEAKALSRRTGVYSRSLLQKGDQATLPNTVCSPPLMMRLHLHHAAVLHHRTSARGGAGGWRPDGGDRKLHLNRAGLLELQLRRDGLALL